MVVRPTSPAKPLPTLLEFTIYDSQNYAKECAAHGYVGVVAYTRGVHEGAGRSIPYQHDGDDARAVIDWIAKQAWSDGRVGMYGDGYSGFAAWAAANRLPPALKAIATSGAERARNRFSDGRQHLSKLGVSVVVLRDRPQGVRRERL